MKTPSAEKLDSIVQYLPAFSTPKLLKSKWKGGEKDKDGVMTFPWEEPSPTVWR